MSPAVIMRRLCVAFGALCLITAVSGQATYPGIDVRVLAEVETTASEDGVDVIKLVSADRVVPGDLVIYTVEIRNAGSVDAVAPIVIRPIPAHMTYIADSATGPGAEVTYSIDGGHSFDHPEKLKVLGSDHRMRRALAIDYTHIRWQLRSTLKPKSVAYARFRAVVK
jgi:uncharacterized repeat protein (TIGR01451 family)